MPVQRIKAKINVVPTPGNVESWTKLKDRLSRLLGGWSAYFGYGSRGKTYKAVDHHVCGRARHFLTSDTRSPTAERDDSPAT